MNILVCTLGASWAVIPEVFGFLAPARLDLYAHHPQAAHLQQMRLQHRLQPPDELWVCTTEGTQTRRSLDQLRCWWQRIGAPLPLRIWTAAGTDQLATQAECDHIRELTFRVVLRAVEGAGPAGQVILSLAGGRKTMSADLQTAGHIFGAHAWLHVVGPDPLPAAIAREATPERFATPLPADLAAAIMPLVVGQGVRDELMDLEIDGRRVDGRHFALDPAAPDCAWPLPPAGCALSDEITRRQREGQQLLGNYLLRLGEHEHHENWRSLYRLPARHIDSLRHTALHAGLRDWLQALPKADLHRHLGGCLDLNAQRQVGAAIWAETAPAERDAALAAVRSLLAAGDAPWPWNWPQQLAGPRRAEQVAALLTEADDAALLRNLYAETEPRIALKTRNTHGFSAYERPGELTGSAVLGHPSALVPYARALVTQARAEGLAYLELRGSPQKYREADPGGFLKALRQALQEAGANGNDDNSPRIGFIWILDRRQRDSMADTVAKAVAALTGLEGFLLGLDLAGDEGTQRPEELAPHFAPAFRECLPVTIHAGEGEAADNIWQAAYHLHADRIGHGLSLASNPRLLARFRNRGICLELCPSSNREVVGFHDPAFPASAGLPQYPLRDFLNAGLPLTLCTDNPGISRTTLADEYLAAARMTQGGLSQWEALALTRQGFSHAFLPSADKEQLMKRVDRRVHAMAVAASLQECQG